MYLVILILKMVNIRSDEVQGLTEIKLETKFKKAEFSLIEEVEKSSAEVIILLKLRKDYSRGNRKLQVLVHCTDSLAAYEKTKVLK